MGLTMPERMGGLGPGVKPMHADEGVARAPPTRFARATSDRGRAGQANEAAMPRAMWSGSWSPTSTCMVATAA